MKIQKAVMSPTIRTSFFVVLSAVALVCSLGGWFRNSLAFDPAWIAIVLCGFPILASAFSALIQKHDIKADVLVSMALIASVYTKEYFAAGEVALIMQLGSLLENYTSGQAHRGIEKLICLTPQTARIRHDNTDFVINAAEVKSGNILVIFAGETIPADGILLNGETTVDQSAMTGESIPVEKKTGDFLLSGTINQLGTFEMKAVRDYQDSSLPRMIRLTSEAAADRAPIVRLADKWATWMVVIAFVTSVMTGILTGELLRAVTVLVVFCPCAFILATPTAVAAGIAAASKHGILIRSGDALERFSRIQYLAFDKTGTLTYGKPHVIGVVSLTDSYTSQDLLALAAHAEKLSEHPLGKAVLSHYLSQGGVLREVTDYQRKNGHGVQALVDGQLILIGNQELFHTEKIAIPEKVQSIIDPFYEKGATILFLSINGIFAGLLALSDILRPDAVKSIQKLINIGILPLLLTGDNQASASFISSITGIDTVKFNLLPEEKANIIKEYEAGGKHVCMIGDGINDALALSCASAGIAMGGIGSDIAVEASDAVLVRDDLSSLPTLFLTTRKVMKKIHQNIIISLLINLAAVLLSICGILNPISGALIHNCGSVFVVVNAALLLRSTPDPELTSSGKRSYDK